MARRRVWHERNTVVRRLIWRSIWRRLRLGESESHPRIAAQGEAVQAVSGKSACRQKDQRCPERRFPQRLHRAVETCRLRWVGAKGGDDDQEAGPGQDRTFGDVPTKA